MFYFLSFLFISSCHLFATVCLFSPPSSWEYAKPSNHCKNVEIGFLGKGNHLFRPSLNFATEDVDISLQEYVNLVKKIHKADSSDVLDLGTITTASGHAHLLQIHSTSPYGKICILQSIFVYEKKAYLLTGALLKEDLSTFYKDFLDTFRSLRFVSDLFLDISNIEKRKKTETFYQKIGTLLQKEDPSSKKTKNLLDELDTFLSKECSDLGIYWRFLVVKKCTEDFLLKK